MRTPALLIALCLGACGQSGDLVLPDAKPVKVSAPPASQPAPPPAEPAPTPKEDEESPEIPTSPATPAPSP